MSVIPGIGGAAGLMASSILKVSDVFAASLYTGTGATQSITTGINLSTYNGLVWIKTRSGTGRDHVLYDTVRGATTSLSSDTTSAESTSASGLTTFNSTGFSIGNLLSVNENLDNFVAWTFRKAAKFFDIVTFTGNGTTQTINHSLGIQPGLMIIKQRNAATSWIVWHRGLSSGYHIFLNQAGAQTNASTANFFGNNTTSVDPTATTFTVGNNAAINGAGNTYVVYLFAHDTSTRGFIQCGSYVGNGTNSGPTVTLGWKPQFILLKNISATTGATSGIATNWGILDGTRGMFGSTDHLLTPNTSDLEDAFFGNINLVDFSTTGFTPRSSTYMSENGQIYIYLAIRDLNS